MVYRGPVKPAETASGPRAQSLGPGVARELPGPVLVGSFPTRTRVLLDDFSNRSHQRPLKAFTGISITVIKVINVLKLLNQALNQVINLIKVIKSQLFLIKLVTSRTFDSI